MEKKLISLTKQIYLSDDKQLLMLMPSPLEELITTVELTKILSQSSYAPLKINEAGIQEAVTFLTKLYQKKTIPEDAKPIAIATRLDAQLNITIDPSKLSAKAEIISAHGGKYITLDQITEKIKTLKITHGISTKMLHLLIRKSKNSPPGTLYQGVIAKGDNPVHGTNAIFERLVETPSERILKPQKKENGQVDMRDLGELVTVSTGTAIMRKIPPQEGSPGMTIAGEPIKQLAGEDSTLNIGENTELDPNDENILLATVGGVPHEIENGMRVDDALLINNVDVGSGNVNFKGDVIIAGDICDGMEIKASGNITVAGFIESAHIECAGDLFVGKGILGRKRTTEGAQFSCNINCKGSVTATFSQYTHMNVGKDLHIKNQLLHCLIKCHGHISVQNDSGNKGVILGGLLSAYKGISTVVLGAPAGTKTLIDLTGLYPELIATKSRIEKNIKKEELKIHSIFETQKIISTSPLTKKRKAIDARLSLAQKETESTILTFKSEQEDNLTAIQNYLKESRLVASNKLHSQISISIGNDIFLTQKNYGPTRFSLENENIVAAPYQS